MGNARWVTYNKIFTKILDSSIWLESSPTRIVWVTLIAAMDEQGFAQFAAAANVARRANVTIEEARRAIGVLESPDADSSDPDFGGRRVQRVPGGWMVLNAPKYRALVKRSVIQEQTAERVRKFREKQRGRRRRKGNVSVTQASRCVTPSEAEAEASTEEETGARALAAPIEDRAKETPTRRPTTGSGVMAGMLPRDHLRHTFCGERVCMHETQFAQFCRDFGGDPDTAAERVKVFCEAVNATWLSSGAPIGDDLFEFWRARKLEHLGTTTKTSAEKKREREEAIWAKS